MEKLEAATKKASTDHEKSFKLEPTMVMTARLRRVDGKELHAIFCCNRQREKLQPVPRLATPGKTRRRLNQIVVGAVTVDMNGCSDSYHRS